MLYCNWIKVSKCVDINKTNDSGKCKIYQYKYFFSITFRFHQMSVIVAILCCKKLWVLKKGAIIYVNESIKKMIIIIFGYEKRWSNISLIFPKKYFWLFYGFCYFKVFRTPYTIQFCCLEPFMILFFISKLTV